MRILIVSQYFWPESFRINDVAIGLRDRGHIVSVLTGLPNYPTGSYFAGYGPFHRLSEEHEGVRIFRAPVLPRGKGSAFGLVGNFVSFVFSASFAAILLRMGKQDAILVYEPSPITVGFPAIVSKARHGAPILFWVQDLWPETLEAVGAIRSKGVLGIVGRIVKFIYNRCDLILVQSRGFIESIKGRCNRRANIKYLPNSTEDYYQPVTVNDDALEASLMPRGFVVLFAGNIGVAQDFPTILTAAEITRRIDAIRWVVIGDGRQREWLQREIIQRNLENCVHLLGRFPAEQMPRFFSRADALLVALKKEPIFALTIPSKVQSYLACARPIVASLDGEGARIVEESGAGISCPAESPHALANAVISLYRTPLEERDRMGKRGREYFDREFGRTMLIDRLEKWLKEAVSKKGTSRKGEIFREAN